MPRVDRSKLKQPAPAAEMPRNLKPFNFHKVNLSAWEGKQQVTADCPLCGREGKFVISIETSQWRCWGCSAAGNAKSFLTQLWQRSYDQTDDWEDLKIDRKLLHAETLTLWGACRSAITGEWLLPAYTTDGKLHQLYRRHKLLKDGRWVMNLSPPPGVHAAGESHGLFGVPYFNGTVNGRCCVPPDAKTTCWRRQGQTCSSNGGPSCWAACV